MDTSNDNGLKGIRVLVLDDEEPIRRLIDRLLSIAGCSVMTAADGRKGLQILMQHDFDVMIVDLRMQEMDGIAFLQEALKIWPWLGVIVITGYADEDSIAQAQQLGVRRILRKPLSLDILRRRCRCPLRTAAPAPERP